jgi:hypothetical protein
VLKLSNEHLVYQARAGRSAITVALNMSVQTATLPLPSPAGVVLAGNGELLPEAPAVRLPASGWAALGPAG